VVETTNIRPSRASPLNMATLGRRAEQHHPMAPDAKVTERFITPDQRQPMTYEWPTRIPRCGGAPFTLRRIGRATRVEFVETACMRVTSGAQLHSSPTRPCARRSPPANHRDRLRAGRRGAAPAAAPSSGRIRPHASASAVVSPPAPHRPRGASLGVRSWRASGRSTVRARGPATDSLGALSARPRMLR